MVFVHGHWLAVRPLRDFDQRTNEWLVEVLFIYELHAIATFQWTRIHTHTIHNATPADTYTERA